MSLLKKLVLDACVFFGFLIVNKPNITGESLHEWFGLALFFALLVHLVLHWQWVGNVVRKFFSKMGWSARINFFVDFLIFVAFIAVTVSGVMISKDVLRSLGITLPRNASWKQLHSISADASFYLLALHFALHWSWITGAVKKSILHPIRRFSLKLTKKETKSISAGNN